MKHSHHSLRRWVTTVALTAALLDSQLSTLAAESIVPPLDPAPAADANPDNADVPAETNPLTADQAPSAAASVEAAPVSVPQTIPVPPSPAAPATPAPQTLRLEAARQRVEAHLAAIVARDQAAKTAQLQQNLVATALHYAEAGNFEQARRMAAHPGLPAAMQAETLAKIAAIALMHQGASTAVAIAPSSNAATTAASPSAATAPTIVTLTPDRLALPRVPARAASFARSPFRSLVGYRCLPQQASFLSVAAPTPIAAASIAAPPIKAIGTLTSLKSSIRPTAGRAVVIPSIELRSPNQAAPMQAIEVKLAGVVDSISASAQPLPAATAPQPTKFLPFSGIVSSIVKASPPAVSTAESPPSLPVVYVAAKVNQAQTAQPADVPAAVPAAATSPAVATNAAATNCQGAGFAAVRYSARSAVQQLAQFGMAFPLPIPAALTSAFGWRIHPISGDRRFHAGIDLGAPMGTPVLAALPGQVVVAGNQGGYGLTVILENQGHRNLYAHLSAIAVQPGQAVSPGNIIGWVGSTGNSTGPHLHFESQYLTAQGWQAIDPLVNGTLARGQ